MAGILDSKRLWYFRAIAEHGSFSAAARSLNLAQPALSHHVAELENRLGVQLLERRSNGVALTPAGSVLFRHAVEITTHINAAEHDLLAISRTSRAQIRIRLAVITSLAADLTPVLFSAMARKMPDVVLRITEVGTQDCRELLNRGEADIAVYLTPATEDKDDVIAREQLYFLVRSDRAPNNTPITFLDVAAQPLIMPAPGNPLRALLENAAGEAGTRLKIALEIDGAAPRRNAVFAGLGASVFGAHAARSIHDPKIATRRIVEPDLVRAILFGSRRGLDRDLTARIRDVLTGCFAELGGMETAARA